VTERVRLGTLVLCASFRHPALLAKAAAAIDLLSGGRLELGLGAGWLQEEFAAFGYRFGSIGERFAALQESVEVIGGLFDGESMTFDGPTVTLREAAIRPVPAHRPPIWLGGKGGPRLLKLAARSADGWNVVWRMAADDYAAKVEDVRVACEAADRDPVTFGLSVGLYSLIGEDEAAARAAFERGRAAAPGTAMDADDYEAWRADTLSGTPDQVLERVSAFEELGVQELIVAPWVLPFAIHDPEQVELFAERVMRASRAA
jgi:alkanesulfonate monooxygenase SsuD/methylene tetrahydromethanopterin reductase-like flavin-dependent oxidoreductase (luciferase family)